MTAVVFRGDSVAGFAYYTPLVFFLKNALSVHGINFRDDYCFAIIISIHTNYYVHIVL